MDKMDHSGYFTLSQLPHNPISPHPLPPTSHTQTHTHACVHTHTHARTHTHTHSHVYIRNVYVKLLLGVETMIYVLAV